jgi:hypothetical protein
MLSLELDFVMQPAFCDAPIFAAPSSENWSGEQSVRFRFVTLMLPANFNSLKACRFLNPPGKKPHD